MDSRPACFRPMSAGLSTRSSVLRLNLQGLHHRVQLRVEQLLLVLRYVFHIFHSWSRHVKLAPVHLESSVELSIQKKFSPGPSACLLASSAPSSLLSVKGALLPENITGSTHSVCSLSEVVSMLVHSTTVRANLYLFVSLLRPMSLNRSSSPSTSFAGRAWSSPFKNIVARMSLLGCDLGGGSSLYPYPCCRLLSRESTGQSPASRINAILRAVLNIPVTARSFLLISLWYFSHHLFWPCHYICAP